MAIVRTTIYLPEELSQSLKLEAVQKKTRVNTIIVQSLQSRIGAQTGKSKPVPKVCGRFHLGGSKAYGSRDEIYQIP